MNSELTNAALERRLMADLVRTVADRLSGELRPEQLDAVAIKGDEVYERASTITREVIADGDRSIPGNVDRSMLVLRVVHEAVALGPLHALIEDDEVTEIMVNGSQHIFAERDGRTELTELRFASDETLMHAIRRIVVPLGRDLDSRSPMVDGRLADGSRVNAVVPPLAMNGPCLTIRKFPETPYTTDFLVEIGSLSPAMSEFLRIAVLGRANIVISGGAGTGKTTLLNILSRYIPETDRVITIEDASELKLQQRNVVALESRPPDIDGRGGISIHQLTVNALRMRPDRIIVGECRGIEALDMLQAMNTGHPGSFTTIHSTSPRQTISRIQAMLTTSDGSLTPDAIQDQLAAATPLVVQLSRFADGSRKIVSISEITGRIDDVIMMQEVFTYQFHGLDANGDAAGDFVATGIIPDFVRTMRGQGEEIDISIFRNGD